VRSAVLSERLPAVFTHRDARTLGISDRQLYAWRDEGAIEVLARGIYVRPGIDADHDLLEIAVRAPRATLCLTTALARHDLIDDIPHSIDVALPRRQRQPRTSTPVTWHRFDDETFDIDRTPLPAGPSYTIGLYGPARCVIDAFRLRHLYGQDQAFEALRRWLRQRSAQPSELLAMARRFPVAEPPLRHAMEILL
jgi:predicted transcriptional regulator of viral defense system